MLHGTLSEEATQLDLFAEPNEISSSTPDTPPPTSKPAPRRIVREVRPDLFARRLDGRIAVLCKDLPPSAEAVLRAVVSAMGGYSSCSYTYEALAAVSSVSVASFKRMIPLLRTKGLLNAFDRDGNYVPAPKPNQPRGTQGTKAKLTLKLGPIFELQQPELETPPDDTLDFGSGRKSGRSTPKPAKPSGRRQQPGLVADRDQSGRKLRPAPPPQIEIDEETPALAGGVSSESADGADDPNGSPPSAEEVRAKMTEARAALKDPPPESGRYLPPPIVQCGRCGQPIIKGEPHTFGGAVCPA